ncbi:MAG: hypothetical protein PWQ57_3296 [Desulfovibrionales bacterium]|jgi:DNA-binding response OmpR family regulator|nr:hypothetical protein [Desulfovibrionales bacterium]
MAGKIKVLMVDDEERFRTTTAKILDRKGFETIMAESGEQAMEMLSQKPHVIVLDIRMKGMSGHETLKKIKEREPSIPVIMLTGHGDSESARKCLEIGAFDYLSKPADSDLLYAKIKEAVSYGKHEGKPVEKRVGDLMIPLEDYAVIEPTATVEQAVKALRDASQVFEATDRLMQTGHRSVLIMEHSKIIGVAAVAELINAVRPGYLSDTTYRSQAAITTWQFSRIFWSGLFSARLKEIAHLPVSQVMSDPPLTIAWDANLMEAADLMYEHNARRLAVIENDKVVGVLREQELFFEMVAILTRT